MEPEGRFFERYGLLTVLWVVVVFPPVVVLNGIIGYPYAVDWLRLVGNLLPFALIWAWLLGVALVWTRRVRRRVRGARAVSSRNGPNLG